MAKEGDQIKWWGIRPTDPESFFTRYEVPDACIAIHRANLVSNELLLLYEVPADHLFYLCGWGFSAEAIAAGTGTLQIFNHADAYITYAASLGCAINQGRSVTAVYPIAYQLDSESTIKILSTVANFWVYGWITGYLRVL